jgi:hypothetical protein
MENHHLQGRQINEPYMGHGFNSKTVSHYQRVYQVVLWLFKIGIY